ncbi:MAG: hypothetical protein K9N51_08915 [Candidatus Pacebacteria bacterium]|nr:hypothetical protein [Candidatus Paceibacterota bacterium]
MKRIECTSCHVTLEVEDDYFSELQGQTIACPECSADITIPASPHLRLKQKSVTARTCPHCGSAFPPGAVLCVQCGYDTRTGRKLNPQYSSPRHNRKPNGIIWGIAGAAVVISIVIAVAISNSNPWQKPGARLSQTSTPASPASAGDREPDTPPASRSSKPESSSPRASASSFQAPASIKGSIHIVFEGYDLPLKQVPVYLIQVTDAFRRSYNRLAEKAIACLQAQTSAARNSREWIRATESLIEVEKERAVSFRSYLTRTVYADNNGMFAFHDLKPGQYVVLVEGTIKDRMTIWSALVDLAEADSKLLDFGESNVGGTERVYAFADVRSQTQPESTQRPRQYTGDELCDMGIAAANRGDNRRAVELFSAGAEAGHALCQYNLGASYIDGLGVAQDYETAAFWYSKAAQQGLAVAQKKLGLCFYRGAGVRQDLSKAAYWFGQAADQGDQEAAQALNELLYEDSKIRGAQKSPPDRDAAERFLTHAADTMVQMKINNGELVSARRVGFQFQYVRGNPKCDANAQVDYEFTFYTRAGTLRRNVGYLFFYHDPTRRDWFNSDTNIDGLPRY